MKRKIQLLAVLALLSTALTGCGQRSENNATGGQPMPDAAASNNVIVPPGVTGNNPNNLASTNWPATNNSGVPNQ